MPRVNVRIRDEKEEVNFYPLLPDKKTEDVARQLGMNSRELFCYRNPAGFSRYASFKFLMPAELMHQRVGGFYASDDGANFKVTLWDEHWGTVIEHTNMWLLPCTPLLWREHGGVALCELVDERYWWQYSALPGVGFTGNPLPPTVYPTITAEMWSSDGRWNAVNEAQTTAQLVTILQQCALNFGFTLQLTPTEWGTINPFPGGIDKRILSDLSWTSGTNLSVIYDQLLAMAGYYMTTQGAKATQELPYIADMYNAYGRWMSNGAGRYGGSKAADISTFGEIMVDQFMGSGPSARAPGYVQTHFPAKAVEGKTRYNNANKTVWQSVLGGTGSYASFDNMMAKWIGVPYIERIPAGLGRAYAPCSAVFPKQEDGGFNYTGGPPVTDVNSFSDWVANKYAERINNVPYGRTLLAGWNGTALSETGCAWAEWTLVREDDVLAPVMIVGCDEDDWILGYSGKGITEPCNLALYGKGLAHAYRTSNGSLIVDVPPPSTRSFLARIIDTAGTVGQNSWKWKYLFEEVEPTGGSTADPGTITNIGNCKRLGTALNHMEETNVAGAPKFVAPGNYAANFPNATIEALPIAAGTIVHMVEHFLPANFVANAQSADPPGPRYWFCVPNAIKVTCLP